MPPKNDPKDWDRLFRPDAPRRGGPLRALSNVLLIGAIFGILGGGAFFAVRFGLDYARQSAALTAEAISTENARVAMTRTARSISNTATTAALFAATPTVVATPAPIGQGSVVAGGNLRNSPVVADNTVIGQICAGDLVNFLEQRTGADGSLWYRIVITGTTDDCTPQRVTIGSSGWASSTLLSQPTP